MKEVLSLLIVFFVLLTPFVLANNPPPPPPAPPAPGGDFGGSSGGGSGGFGFTNNDSFDVVGNDSSSDTVLADELTDEEEIDSSDEYLQNISSQNQSVEVGNSSLSVHPIFVFLGGVLFSALLFFIVYKYYLVGRTSSAYAQGSASPVVLTEDSFVPQKSLMHLSSHQRYVQECKDKGFSDEDIRSELRRGGYSDEQISELL